MRIIIFLFLVSTCCAARQFRWHRPQTVEVKGVLRCNGGPAAGSIRESILHLAHSCVADEWKLGERLTDANGSFKFEVTTKDSFLINPVLKVYHEHKSPKEIRNWLVIEIPLKYVSLTYGVEEYCDVGTYDFP
ncbi:Transthyretin-like family protein [Ancylostoma caninum]|uniref:Transthyretin-like family protein n=1 Tax=Ancylostoma caninum TaxID=29170 RepID=A0A368G950_ANCCA|nr:Transthyretin-like family protein [Ancylostoma caninum]